MKVIIEADGGSRGNPGIAGSGVVVYSDNKREVLREVAYVVSTQASNNIAEYRGLIEGLRIAGELGATEADVYMDSKLVVEQMSGRWKIKHPDMKELALEARKLAAKIGTVSYTWIPREKNKRADALSNVAMDAAAAGAAPGIIDATSNNTDTPDTPDVPDDSPATPQRAAQPSDWNSAQTKPTRLILLRHGQTAMSVAHQFSGRSNPELTERGREQAANAARRLAQGNGIDAIVSSPLTRCIETAECAAQALSVPRTTIEELVELDFGEWEGLTFAEAKSRDPELYQAWLSDPTVAPPGGESIVEVNRRVTLARERICNTYGAANVLVVSHVNPIKSILGQALGVDVGFFHKLHLDLASFSLAEFYPDGPTCVRLINDTSHHRK